MGHYSINTTPETTPYNAIHPDGRPFNERAYLRDTLRAYRRSALFALRQAQSYAESEAYHLEQYHRFKEARRQAYISAGELTLAQQRIIERGKQLRERML